MTVSMEDINSGINCCRPSTNSSKLSLNESDSQGTNNNSISHTDNNYDMFDVNSPKCQMIDIDFQNIKYTVRKFSFSERKFVTKEILHGISGAFRSGELTAIMGPSGSGKSTLLNVMTGYTSTGVTGIVHVNGIEISTSSESFRRLSCYIHQDDVLRSMLTVNEIMLIAAHLKLGYNVTKDYKMNLIKKILILLGLEKRYNTLTGRLSGGQKKRLAIALEMISNPPVLYLDEPTTGLDSSSCIQCVSLLKRLAKQGHTVVCTIHQPSALLFEMFDKLYTVAEGNCIYQGPVKDVVSYLSDLGLHCPSYHNPADYMLEVAAGEHDRDLNKMINAASKKYYENSDLHEVNGVGKFMNNIQVDSMELNPDLKSKVELLSLSNGEKCFKKSSQDLHTIQPASVFMQYWILLNRNLTCSRRKYFSLLSRIFCHVFIGFIFGYLYLNVGPTANTVMGNYVYIYGTILLIVYTGKMAVVLSFPLELDMLRREHFNRWYKLGPYFLSVISFEIPFQVFCVFLYMIISFYLTGNFSQNFRFYYFVIMGVLATLSAQAWGFFVGATLPVKLAVFAGPILAVLFSVFGFFTRYIDITPIFRWMWHISYFRAAFHGVLNAIYGMDRPFLECPPKQMYCHFRSGKVFLTQMMISDVSMEDSIYLMSSIIVIMHILTIFTLWYQLNKR